MTSPRFTLLQSRWWRRVREQQGWTALSDKPLVLCRRVGPLRLAYSPHAFAAEPGRPTREYVARLRAIAAAADPSPQLLRWDIPFADREGLGDDLAAEGLRPSPVRVQPASTVVVGLGEGEEACLAAMKGKWRYNIRLAQRKGVVVERYTGSAIATQLPQWYQVYRETAARDRISIHPEQYYRVVLETAVEMRAAGEEAPEPSLYLARHDGDLLGGIVVVSWQGMSTYLYGASSSARRNLMGNYALQWAAMAQAIGQGDHSYDLFGIPPTEDPKHPMHGLYRFKTGFGGRIVHRPGCRDLVMRPVPAGLFRHAERARSWYHHRLRKGRRS